MSEAPRSRRFQFHLSTAIVLMFVAGGLMWGNVLPNKDWSWEGHGFGWPWINMEVQSTRHVITPRGTLIGGPTETFVHWTALWNDIVFWFFILFVVWFVCEWLIRRRATHPRA
jgi:hypothetical protein